MFGFFKSRQESMRENAANWLELADRVWEYRKDLLDTHEMQEFGACTQELRRRLRERADAAKLKLAIEALEGILARTGGSIYPKSALVEYVEFFLVAAVVVLGVRTYFVQPFKIPTNSMWPTYYGMTAENFPPGTQPPGGLARLARLAIFGAQRRTMIAPRSGPVSVPIFTNEDGSHSLAYTIADGYSWFVIPTKVRLYTFSVAGEPVSLEVPVDFDPEKVFVDTYFANRGKFEDHYRRARDSGQLERLPLAGDHGRAVERTLMAEWMPTGVSAQAGEPILRFDLLAGDQLFVDRFSFNFVRPKVGEGFVFRTDNIPDIARSEYFIKRLVGVPGDVVEIRDPVIYRNGVPITGAEAFDLNARRVSPYLGYSNAVEGDNRFRMLYTGVPVTVPDGEYLALGDNSHQSRDGRFWGFVPAKDVAGRPLFIYFPFTKRWGPAR